MQKGISIIICCYNSAERLPLVLENLSHQKYTDNIDYEIIVVDNASTDNTAEIAKQSWNGIPDILTVITEKKPGLSYARMAGLASSNFDIINFIDDDNLVNDQWIYRINKIMRENENIGMLGGLGFPKFNITPPSWFEKFKDAYAVGPQGRESGPIPAERAYLHGAGISIRKKIWTELEQKGFKFYLTGRQGKSLSSGEDFELSSAVALLGYKLYYDESLEFFHLIPDNRLNKEYIIRLYEAFGKASNVVHAYKTIVNNASTMEKMKYNYYITGLFYSLYKYLEFNAKLNVTAQEEAKKFDLILSTGYWKNNLNYKLTQPKRVMQALRDIKKFVKNCERERKSVNQ